MSIAGGEPRNKVNKNEVADLAKDLLSNRDEVSGDGIVDILNEVSEYVLGGTPQERQAARNAIIRRLNDLSAKIPFLK